MAKTNQEKQTPLVAVEVLEELSADEERERHRLELRVERAVFEGGAALRSLRDMRLYRSTHSNFDDYCRDRFGFTRQSANYLIAGAGVYENLTTIGCQILPTSERQVRHLSQLEARAQQKAWQQAVDLVGGKVPSGRIVKDVVVQLKEKDQMLASDFCNVGDVFILTKLEGTERKYNGCWAIASNTHGITVGVDVHDGTLRVKPENLKPIDSPEIHRTLPAIHRRIKRLRKCGKLDRSAEVMLSHMGRQTYLTDLEEKFFYCMEQHCGIVELN